MQANTLRETSRRGEQLRYVTMHSQDLRGLQMAPLWAALLVLANLAAHRTFSLRQLGLLTLAVGVGQVIWHFRSENWYEQRYGVVKEPDPVVGSGLISIMHPEVQRVNSPYYRWMRILVLAYALNLPLVPFQPFGDAWIQHAWGFTCVGMLAMLQILPRCSCAVASAWPIRLRRILARGGLLAITGMFLTCLFIPASFWMFLDLLFAALLLLDLYDYWLLNRLLSGNRMEWSYEQGSLPDAGDRPRRA
jgi:hypothetical protein